MIFARVFSLRAPVLAVTYLTGYVLLDWLSFIEPFAPFGITPWNPPTGLSFILVLLFGQRFLPLLFVAPLLANALVRGLPVSWPVEIAADLIIGGGYSVGLLALLQPRSRFNPALTSMRDVGMLIGAAALSSGAVAVGYVGLLVTAALLPLTDFMPAALRFWIGDLIGITVVAPFALIFLTRGKTLLMTRETAAQLVAIFAVLVVVFLYAGSRRFELFYLLFLPIIWMAVRGGLEMVTLGIMVTQLGLIFFAQVLPPAGVDITSFQALMLVLALTGLAAGAVVTEHRRAEARLRRHQDSLAHVSRLGSMGELAAMLAHEINQPLMAAGTYTRLVTDSLRELKVPNAMFETAEKAAAQVQRAAEVVRQLRAFIRLDQSNRAPVNVERIVREAIELYRPELERSGVAVRAMVDAGLPQVEVDLLQIEQVLLNLMKNSVEAITEIGQGGAVTINVVQESSERVGIEVHDTGPGFPPELLSGDFAALPSRKVDGFGIGLSLCRSIVEAHGGQLRIVEDSSGATVCFNIPVAGGS
jgi:signal transduction histidine kinase